MVEIVYVEPDLSLWVIPDSEIYGDMIQETSSSNAKTSRHAIRIKPESVSLKQYLDVIDTSNPSFVERARLKTASITQGQTVKVHCYSANRTKGILICRIMMNDINLSEALISSGFSQFEPEPGMTPLVQHRLSEAQEFAKKYKEGIWMPMYGLFREN